MQNIWSDSFSPSGAPGVGRSHIKNSLLTKYSDKFSYPAPRKSLRRFPSNKAAGFAEPP